MKSNIDSSIIEVWEMKDLVLRKLKTSKYKEFSEFAKNETKDFIKQHNIKFRTKEKAEVTD